MLGMLGMLVTLSSDRLVPKGCPRGGRDASTGSTAGPETSASVSSVVGCTLVLAR